MISSQTLNTVCIKILHGLTWFEQYRMFFDIIKYIKIAILKRLIAKKDFLDNTITNIVCTKLDKNGKCDRALIKLTERQYDIFRVSPRALVACVLNKNKTMLKELRRYGYPIEMVQYAENFGLIKKMCNREMSVPFPILCKYSMHHILYGV